MPGNPTGLRRGALILPAPLDILGSAEDGREGGGILQIGSLEIQGGGVGRTVVPHHLQCGGGCGGETLG